MLLIDFAPKGETNVHYLRRLVLVPFIGTILLYYGFLCDTTIKKSNYSISNQKMRIKLYALFVLYVAISVLIVVLFQAMIGKGNFMLDVLFPYSISMAIGCSILLLNKKYMR